MQSIVVQIPNQGGESRGVRLEIFSSRLAFHQRVFHAPPKSGVPRERPLMTTRAENSRVDRYGPNIMHSDAEALSTFALHVHQVDGLRLLLNNRARWESFGFLFGHHLVVATCVSPQKHRALVPLFAVSQILLGQLLSTLSAVSTGIS